MDAGSVSTKIVAGVYDPGPDDIQELSPCPSPFLTPLLCCRSRAGLRAGNYYQQQLLALWFRIFEYFSPVCRVWRRTAWWRC